MKITLIFNGVDANDNDRILVYIDAGETGDMATLKFNVIDGALFTAGSKFDIRVSQIECESAAV